MGSALIDKDGQSQTRFIRMQETELRIWDARRNNKCHMIYRSVHVSYKINRLSMKLDTLKGKLDKQESNKL